MVCDPIHFERNAAEFVYGGSKILMQLRTDFAIYDLNSLFCSEYDVIRDLCMPWVFVARKAGSVVFFWNLFYTLTRVA